MKPQQLVEATAVALDSLTNSIREYRPASPAMFEMALRFINVDGMLNYALHTVRGADGWFVGRARRDLANRVYELLLAKRPEVGFGLPRIYDQLRVAAELDLSAVFESMQMGDDGVIPAEDPNSVQFKFETPLTGLEHLRICSGNLGTDLKASEWVFDNSYGRRFLMRGKLGIYEHG